MAPPKGNVAGRALRPPPASPTRRAAINSVCQFFGRRRFDVEDKSTNVAWLAIATFGESWHHNHHAFPRSARQGLGRWEIDPSAMFIRMLEKLGVAENVVRITPERQQAKLAGAGPVDSAKTPAAA